MQDFSRFLLKFKPKLPMKEFLCLCIAHVSYFVYKIANTLNFMLTTYVILNIEFYPIDKDQAQCFVG
jgi:hypothetical protein